MAPRTWCSLWLSFKRESYGLPCNSTPPPPTHLNAQIAHTIIELRKSYTSLSLRNRIGSLRMSPFQFYEMMTQANIRRAGLGGDEGDLVSEHQNGASKIHMGTMNLEDH